ncbi:MAG: 50S ribosomal protein L28 [Deltaproteobacteria bacterium]|nr:50S ribosomal protein L28 [Deltaproteobacteria bacterium]
MPQNTVSHANNRLKTRNLPNLKKVRALVKGQVQRVTVCTRCLRSGKIQKAA